MRRQRPFLVSLGTLIGVAFVLTAALSIPSARKTKHRQPMPGCARYFLIPVEWICGNRVFWVNPDGSKVQLGKSSQLRMPRPRPVQSH